MGVFAENAWYHVERMNRSRLFKAKFAENSSWGFYIWIPSIKHIRLFFYPWDTTDENSRYYGATIVTNGRKDRYRYRIQITFQNIFKMYAILRPYLKDVPEFPRCIQKMKMKRCHQEVIKVSLHPSRLQRHFDFGGTIEDWC